MKLRSLFILLPLILVSGCAMGPNYERPAAETPPAFTEGASWKEAQPRDDIPKGKWWEVYSDKQLDELEELATASNQDLKVAMARLDQARAASRTARASFLPSVNLDSFGSIFRESANRPVANPTSRTAFEANNTQSELDLSYEIDVWGRLRREYESAKATLQASAAEYQTALLTLHAEVAQDYFNLRATDGEQSVLTQAVELYRKELDLIKVRQKGGINSDLDVARAETELANAEADLATLRQNRAEVEHALAVLVGKPVENFHLPAKVLTGQPPAIPVGLPSDLLERRPDVAEAERMMAATNAKIGVAKAAFFPAIELTGAAGFQSAHLGNLFAWPSTLWSLGPGISIPFFDAGRNSANLDQAKAAYDEAVARYRSQVLVAFKETEDALAGMQFLSDRAAALHRAVVSSQKAYDLSKVRYKDGLVSYLDVIDSQRSALAAQRAEIETLGQRYIVHVLLIKALGGGWGSVPALSL